MDVLNNVPQDLRVDYRCSERDVSQEDIRRLRLLQPDMNLKLGYHKHKLICQFGYLGSVKVRN